LYKKGIGMKGGIVQNFLRLILSVGVFSLFSTLYLIGSEEKNDQTISMVSSDVLKNQIEKIETKDLKDEEKKKIIELYNVSLSNLEKIKSYHAETESFKQTRKTASTEIEKLHNTINKREQVPPQEMLRSFEMLTLLELVDRHEKEKADLSAVEAKLSAINNLIVVQSSRPNIAKERLIELKRQVDAATTISKPLSLEGNMDLMRQAEVWMKESQIVALSSEIKMLDQELLSHQERMKILKLQRDLVESKVRNITTRVALIDDLLNKRRLAEAKLVQQQVETTKEESKDKHPLLRKLAEQNVALGEKLKIYTLDLENISDKESHNRESAKRIGDDLSSMNQKLQFAGMNQELGEILIKQHNTLPKVSVIQREISRSKKNIANSGLEQLNYAEEYKHLRDIDAYLKDFTKGIPQNEADSIRIELKELAKSRQALLNQVIELKSSYSQALEELDMSLRKLLDVVKSYNQFLAENLLWIRSTKPVSFSLLKSFPGEVERLLSPSSWVDVGYSLIEQFKSKLTVSFLLFVLVVLIFMRRSFLHRAIATNEKIRSVRTDHFGYTIQAFFWTALASLPLPLSVMIIGWQLSIVPEPTEFSNAVSAAILRMSIDFLYLLFIADLAIPNGIIVKHFLWSEKIASKLHRELKWLMVLILPSLFIVVYSVSLESVGISGVLTLLGILCIIGSIGFFLFRTFTPNGGVLAKYYEENADNFIVRYRFIWEKLFAALIIVTILLVLLGYIHTASMLTHNLFITIWIIYALVLMRGLLARWLLLVNRRLEVQAILIRREEARIAKEAIEKTGEKSIAHDESVSENDESEVDLVDLGTKSRKLLDTMLFSAGVVALWFIWSHLLPAFSFLNEISLWSSVGIVDGVDKMIPVTLGDLILATIVIIITIIASRGLPALLEFILLQSKDTTVGGRYTATTLFRYVIIAIGTLSFFSIIGASWSKLQWLAAALSVGIGFGLQEIVANFISGLIILFERPIRVGDTVTVGTTTGIVSRIQIRATTITTWDRQELLVPNKEFITTQLLNWTLTDQTVRVVIPVGIAYGSDVQKAMKLLKEAAEEHNGILKSPESFVTFESFGDNALQLTLRAYLPSLEKRLDVITELHESINEKFNEAGISIAFPQRDIHFDTSKPIDIRVQK
jgi:potassium efflux system protein